MNPFFSGPPPGPPFGVPPGPPAGAPFGFPPGPPPCPPFGFPPQGPPPCMNAKTRYIYRTRNGGPPDMGKPPAPPGPPPPYGSFGLPSFPPGPPPPGPLCFGGLPPPPGAPAGPWVFQPPAAPPPAGPSHLCFQNANGTTCVPIGAAPPAAPPVATAWTTTTTTTAPAPAPLDPATYKGPICRAATATTGSIPSGPAPGNRVNERIVKADDGSGVLLSPDQTCFHVLEPGQMFGPHLSRTALVKDVSYKVQYADSDWPVDKVIELLGGKKIERTGRRYFGNDDIIGIQEWIPTAGDYFQEGSPIMLRDARAKKTLREVGWGPERGRAGQKPPVWVMLYPVKEPGD